MVLKNEQATETEKLSNASRRKWLFK